jgi:ribonuclease P protein subunit RPR2
MKKKQKDEAQAIARERIEKLFSLAEKAAIEGDLESADRYVAMAWKIKLKFRLRLAKEQKRLFCRKCLKFLPGAGKYRTEKGMLVISCPKCGESVRIVLTGKPKRPDFC